MSGAGSLEVTVNAEGFEEADAPELARAVHHTLSSEGVRDVELSLTLLDDAGIQDLNRRFLARDCPTDVIAFALRPGPALLGDVYLGVEQARRQALDLGIPVAEELVRLAVHGTLHVLGHDHPDGEGREESPMFARQEALVRELRGPLRGAAHAPLADPRRLP